MKCRICHSTEYKTYQVKELHYNMGDVFSYIECSHCKCLQIESFPDDMSKYYPGNYYSLSERNSAAGSGSKFRLLPYYYSIFRRNITEQLLHKFFGHSRFDVLNQFKIDLSTRILDVGCGNGFKYLFPLREMGFWNILGCDPYLSEPIEYTNGLSILKADISGVSGTWDVIMYHHSFEHVSNPHENLAKVSELLSPNGVCLIRIPTVSSYAWEKYREYWYQLDAPRHFFLHSVDSIKHLASQYGLRVVNIIYDSNHKQLTNSEKYLRGKSMVEPEKYRVLKFIVRKLVRLVNQRKAITLNRNNRGDQAAFILQKKAA